MGSVANSVLFPSVKEFENRLRTDRVINQYEIVYHGAHSEK